MASESIYAPKNIQAKVEDDLRSSLEEVIPINPYLSQPLLYISGIDRSVTDRELANGVFQPFVPVRLKIDRSATLGEKVLGTVDFKSIEQAERALAIIQDPHLSINEDPSSDPKPNAKPRLIKQLPPNTEDVDVYDTFRPYGPLSSTRRILISPQGQYTGFRGMAVVVYYHEEDAHRAQAELHCAEVEGRTISVSIDTTRRPSGQLQTQTIAPFSATAPAFVPGAMTSMTRPMNAAAPAFQPPQWASFGNDSSPTYASDSTSQQGGITVPVPGSHLHYSASAATYIDPRNLFCKNLDPSVDSNYLFDLFKDYGTIVSARVMRDDKGASREFGFVSFERKEDADRALRAMNQVKIGSKLMTVRLHEPKTIRQEKLSHKFGSSYNGPIDSSNEAGPSSDIGSSREGTRSSSVEGIQSHNGSKQVIAHIRNGVSQDENLLPDLGKVALSDSAAIHNCSSEEINKETILRDLSPPTTSTSPGSLAGSERDRLVDAVSTLLPTEPLLQDIIDLLVDLPKKEKAKMLFNEEYLRKKVDEAKTILELASDEEGEDIPTPLTKENIDLASLSHLRDKKHDGAVKSKEATYTLNELARMPAADIIKLTKSSQAASLPFPKADALVTQDTDAFIDSLQNLPLTDQKQKVGDQLFKKIKAFGVKGAPKITIALLDGEDLRSLAHLMNSYPDCLREKVLLHTCTSK